MDLRITPESTPTRYVPNPSEPKIDTPAPENPPEHLLLSVVMTFTDARVHLDVLDTDVSAEGKTVWEAFRQLVAAANEYVTSVEGERANLSLYAPHTWFRFVPPDQARYHHRAADFWPDGENVEDFIAAATEGRNEEEEDEPDS